MRAWGCLVALMWVAALALFTLAALFEGLS